MMSTLPVRASRVRQSGAAAEEIGKLAGTTNELLAQDGKPLVQELRRRRIEVERLVLPDEVHSFLRHASWLAVQQQLVHRLGRRRGLDRLAPAPAASSASHQP